MKKNNKVNNRTRINATSVQKGHDSKKTPQVQDSVTNDSDSFGRGWFGVNNVQNTENDENAQEDKNTKRRG